VRRGVAYAVCALADDILGPPHRDAVIDRMAASPALTQALSQQLVAINAIRRLDMPAPASLREHVEQAIRRACGLPMHGPPR